MRGNLSVRHTWAILLYMIDPSNSKTTSRNCLTTLLNKFAGTSDQLLSHLRKLHLAQGPQEPLSTYAGQPNETIDRPTSTTDVRAALLKIRPNSLPGEDATTNKLIGNLVIQG
ncbi:hypothetical protein HPB48_000551 [Haemaphysalis longicornis]|uniref:Uncharacterized protein n=1 Tax=Haemaphysalis longicornis TaxID=44386 RepID=A0A9J6FP66_HAELO|nr:hypothetical protein HPB48_000551 [Haemaphysalis longicornis]